jgi:hypothetical protein
MVTLYGAVPPNGDTTMEPSLPAQVASLTLMFASVPATICIEGNVPHLGLIVAEFKGQVLFGEASVQAKNKFVSFNDWPQLKVI